VNNNNASWGLIFRRQGDNIYNFAINDIQEYASWVKNDGIWTNLIGWTRSELVKPNKFNELTVLTDGSEIMYFLNGVPIGSINDSTLSSGNVGFTVGLNFAGNQVVFEFDDFEFREKP
jgi:hypothetical protein